MTKMKLGMMALLLGAMTAPMAANAQSADQITAKFAAADKDHDGKLTLEEAKAGMPRVAKHFDEIDRDHKGYVTVDDILAMYKQHR